MDNPASKGKIIYNVSVSLFMFYFLIRSLYAFFDYTFNYNEKLYANLELQVELKAPASVNQLQEKLAKPLVSIEPILGTQNVIINCKSSDFKELPQLKKEITESLQQQLPEGSYTIVRSQFFPPKISKRIFRLELTVYIPAFIMAIFWFVYVYKWINEIRGLAKNKSNEDTGEKKS